MTFFLTKVVEAYCLKMRAGENLSVMSFNYAFFFFSCNNGRKVFFLNVSGLYFTFSKFLFIQAFL